MAQLDPNPRQIMVCDERMRMRWPMPFDLVANTTASSGMLAEQLRCFARVVRGMGAVPFGARYEDGMTLLGWQTALQENCRCV